MRVAFALVTAVLLACSSTSPTEPSAAATIPPAPPPGASPVVEPSPPAEPVVNAASTSAHAHVQTRTFGQPLPAEPQLHFVPISDAPTSLAAFHAALRRLEAGEDPDGKVRVAIYGSSSVAVDRYPGYLRGYLQHRFGDGGIGFVAAAPLWRWHRHNEVVVGATKGWSTDHAQKASMREGGMLGLLGAAQYATRKRVATTIGGSAPESFSPYGATRRVELHYLGQPGGGRFTLALGDRKLATVRTRADVPVSVVHTPELPVLDANAPLAPLRIGVLGDGEVRLLGASLETEAPGVVVDSLGIGGTRAANMLAWDEASWATALRARAPDLYVLAYGANECMDLDQPIEAYEAQLEGVLERFAAAAPQASCVLIGPVDFPEQDPETGAWVPRARLGPIIEVQREVAREHHCGFYDTRALMGGPGTMDSWVLAELARPDHLHLTKRGYLQLGRMFTDALMRDFDLVPGPTDVPPPGPTAAG